MENYLEKIPLMKPDDIEIRVGQINKQRKFITLLLYKNARVDMQILDEVFGTFGWKRTHRMIGNNLCCTISIWDEKNKQWIEKEDVGTEGNIEAEKSVFSDSLKRSSVSVGIGRELYSAPPIKVYPPDCAIDESNGKLVCWDRFVVSDISYTSSRKIKHLVICKEERNGKLTVVYEYNRPDSRNKVEQNVSNKKESQNENANQNDKFFKREDILYSLPFQFETLSNILGKGVEEILSTAKQRFNVQNDFSDLSDERLDYVYNRVLTWVKKAYEKYESEVNNDGAGDRE